MTATSFAIVDGLIIDGTGGESISDGLVLIEDGKITTCNAQGLKIFEVEAAAVVGQAAAPFTFIITNTGGSVSGVVSASTTGANTGAFPITGDTCSGAVLVPSGSCTVAITFAPATVAPLSASLVVSAAPGGTVTATNTGTGVGGAELALSPSSFDYGVHPLFGASAPADFLLQNVGAGTSGLLSVSLSGSPAFESVGTGCGLTVAPGAQNACFVSSIRFNPQSPGIHSAVLQVTASPGGTVSTSLSAFATSCGDGILDGGEACDDQANINGDGCDAGCNVEPGFTCVGQPSSCTPSSSAAIGVLSATYGGNCGVPQGNATFDVAASCNGLSDCNYFITVGILGDPAGGCAKDFVVDYTCDGAGFNTAFAPAEANDSTINLSCAGPGGEGEGELECPAGEIPSGNTCVTTPFGLVHCWGGNGNGNDVVSGNDAIVYPDMTFTEGLSGDAFTCSGVPGPRDSGAQLGALRPTMNPDGPWTLEMFIKVDTGGGVIFDRENDGFSDSSPLIRLSVGAGGGGSLLLRDSGNTVARNENFPWKLGVYQHFALVRGGGFFTLYVKGELVTSFVDGFGGLTPDPFKLCAEQDNFPFGMGGQFDSVRVWDRALAATEVEAVAKFGDGSCAASVNGACGVDNGGCHPEAACTPTGTLTVACDCLPGFVGNGLTCEPQPPGCVGGSIDDTTVPGFAIHTFLASGTLSCNVGITAEVLVVAGGGGGGGHGGGGGAGGVVHTSNLLIAGGDNAVVVGAGGPSNASETNAINGENSAFLGLIAFGGGAGGFLHAPGNAGGSGGGAARDTANPGGTATKGEGGELFGNDGGTGQGGGCSGGSGGGGAGSAGGASQAGNERGGAGGDGKNFLISGVDTFYAGGGAGGNECDSTVAVGGVGGGGDGGAGSSRAEAGAPNTGGGGGGENNSNPGAGGGSGVVIIRYLLP